MIAVNSASGKPVGKDKGSHTRQESECAKVLDYNTY